MPQSVQTKPTPRSLLLAWNACDKAISPIADAIFAFTQHPLPLDRQFIATLRQQTFRLRRAIDLGAVRLKNGVLGSRRFCVRLWLAENGFESDTNELDARLQTILDKLKRLQDDAAHVPYGKYALAKCIITVQLDDVYSELMNTHEYMRRLELKARVKSDGFIGAEGEPPGLDGYEAADTLWLQDGIRPVRLADAKRAGKVKWKPAPPGMKDSQGKAVRVLYHRGDAIRECKPKRVNKKTLRRLGLGNS